MLLENLHPLGSRYDAETERAVSLPAPPHQDLATNGSRRSFSFDLGVLVVILGCVLDGVFRLADRVLDLALSLLRGSLHLHLSIACPLAGLTLHSTSDIFQLAFNAILIHCEPP